ncbi:MAG: protein kinase [Planctomycetes bacterium]|nr:protein kinase [Planctomycetota bacterium]
MQTGSVLKGTYEIESPLGEGGFARTYRARHRQTGQPCVVKEIDLSRVRDVKTHELFEREAHVLKQLQHARIPGFIDFFEEEVDSGCRIYLVQGYIEGRNLAQLVQAGRHFTEREALEIALGVLDILQYLHGLDPPIIHRDLKPSNIMLGAGDDVHLIDFGAVREKVMRDRDAFGFGFTFVGTYGYMAYEQYSGHALPASDLYALGMTLIFLLSHKEPTDLEASGMRFQFRPHVNVSSACADLIERAIDPDWHQRYPSAAEMRADVEGVLAGRPVARRQAPWRGRRLKRLAAGLTAAVLLGTLWGAAHLTRPRPPARGPSTVSASVPPGPTPTADREIREELPSRPPKPVEAVAGTPWARLPDLASKSGRLQEDSEGNVWVGTTNELVAYRDGDPEGPVWQLNPYFLPRMTEGNGAVWRSGGWSGVMAFYAARPGEIWVSISRDVVLRKRRGKWTAPEFPLKGISDFTPYRGRTYVAGLGGILGWWDESEGAEAGLRLDTSFKGQEISALYATRGGDLLVVTSRDLWKMAGKGWEKLGVDPAYWGYLYRVGEDAQGALLIGTLRGIFNIGPGDSVASHALESIPVSGGFSTGPDGVSWAATTQGLYYRKPGTNEWLKEKMLGVLPAASCSGVLADRHGRVWCAVNGRGVLVAWAKEVLEAQARPAPETLAASDALPLYDLKLFFTWDGRPLHEVTEATPEFSLGQARTMKYEKSRCLVEGVPAGEHHFSARVGGENQKFTDGVGDFHYASSLIIPYRQAAEFEVPLVRFMHMLSPLDNSKKIPHASNDWEDAPVMKSPVRFEWEGFGPDAEYECLMGTMDLNQHSYWDAAIGKFVLRETNLVLDLTPSQEKVLYSLQVLARRRGVLIGRTAYHYQKGGFGWNYSFRVSL